VADVTVLPLSNYNGTRSFGPVAIPDAVHSLVFRVARCTSATPTIWPNEATVLACDIEIFNNGEWRGWAGMRSEGGIASGRFGGEAAETTIGGVLPEGTGRQLRGTVTITSGPLRSTMVISIN
jgi:hypothetical protein